MAVAFAHGVKQQVAITCYEAATPTAPAAPTIEVSVDGGAFAAADNAAAYDAGTAPDGYVVQGACVFVTLSATEMTSAVVVVRVTDGNLTEAQYGGPYYPGGHYTAARGDALDNLDAAVTSRAAAGDAMDLVDAPNATAVAAIQSGLAPAGEYDIELDAPISTRSSHAAADVAALLNDLSSADAQAAAEAALAAYDAATGTDVTTAVSGLSTFDPTTDEVDVGEVKGVAVTGVADFKATGFAVAGDAMALTADERTSVATAVWNSATRTLTSFGTLVADIWANVTRTITGGTVDDVNEQDLTNLDVAVSSRSSHSAADVASAVWAAGTRTLTGFGTLVADIATAVWGAAARTLTAFGFTPSANVTQVAGSAVEGVNDFKADVSALALEATVGALNNLSSAQAQAAATAALNAYDPPTKAELDAAEGNIRGADGDTLKTLSDKIAEGGGGGGDATAENQQAIIDSLTEAKGAGFNTLTDSLEALRDRGDSGAWSGSAGSGSNTITATASDGAGTLANGVKVTVRDDAGNIVAILSTNSLGVCTFYLDDGTYTIVTGSTSIWQGSSTEVEVTADAAVALTLTAQTLPTPSSADKYIIIINATDEYDDAVGAADRSYRLLRIFPAHDASANLIRSTERNPIVTDAQGRASFEIGRGVEGGVLEESWTDAAGAPRTETHTFAVTADAADDDGRIYLADIIIA